MSDFLGTERLSYGPWQAFERALCRYFVHAGFRPEVEIEKQDIDDLLWIRDPFVSSEYDFGKRVIFGHTSFSAPLIMPNKIGLDTGAVFGNRLTCLKLPDMKFIHVEADSV